ncbi:MAG: hypothetical protein VW124_16870, partial [Paracoccaceae bacterium]
MQVTFFTTGTNAILQLLNASKVRSVIIAEDMCPDVISSIIDNGMKIILAGVDRIGNCANYKDAYLKYLDENQNEKCAVLFSHPYGIYQASSLSEVQKTVRKDHVVINDCCLCSPMEILHKSDLALPSVLSFGYSKVLDLDGGGAALTAGELACVSDADVIDRNISRFNQRYRVVMRLHKSYSFSSFLQLPIYSVLTNFSHLVFEHKNSLGIFLNTYFASFECLDSPWRFVVLSKLNRNQVDSLLHTAK